MDDQGLSSEAMEWDFPQHSEINADDPSKTFTNIILWVNFISNVILNHCKKIDWPIIIVINCICLVINIDIHSQNWSINEN